MLSFNGILVSYAIFLYLLLIQPIAAQDNLSPTFSRRMIVDRNVEDVKAINCASSPPNLKSLPDIRAASFSSDGKTLYATLWLSKSLDEIPTIYQARFMMILDIDPTGDITTRPVGSQNDAHDMFNHLDYQVVLTPVGNSTWERQIHELSSTGDIRAVNKTQLKQIDVVDSSAEHYIKLSLDLGLINYPETYSLLFYEDFRPFYEKCIIADLISPPAYVPAPNYDLSVSPRSIIVRPGETKYAELIINSSLQLRHKVSLDAPDKPYYVSIEFEPPEQDIMPNDLGISRLKVNVSSDANVTDVINAVPIEATISFPVLVAQPPADQSTDNTTKQQEQGLEQIKEEVESITKQRKQGLNNTAKQQEQGVVELGNATKQKGGKIGGMNDTSSTNEEISSNEISNNDTSQSLSSSSSSKIRQELLTNLNFSSNNKTKQTEVPLGNPDSPRQKLTDAALSNNNSKQPVSAQKAIWSGPVALSPEAMQSMIEDAVVNRGTVNQSLPKETTLYISVKPSISPQEHFVNFWTVWGSLVGLIAGSFIAGLAGLVFKRKGRSPTQGSES